MLRVARCALAVVSITLTLVGCEDATAPHGAAAPATIMSGDADAAAPLESLLVKPSDTDPAIQGQWLSEHYVWLDPAVSGGNKLFVHMPGTKNTPSSFQLLAKEAARLGYHVIVLTYPNDWEIAICNADPICEENVRLEVIDGVDRSALIAVTPAHSIYNRLTKLLLYLANNYPEQGWAKFLEDGAPDWKRIAISGSSFGGSEAAMLGKLHRVRRVTLFAAPRDTVPGGTPPEWVALGATPAERYYGLVHDRDPLVAATLASWPLLGMSEFGDPAYVDPPSNAPPYGGTHSLLTHLLPSSGSYANAHPSVSRDQFTPLDPDGKPSLRYAWRYMLTAEDADEEVAHDQDAAGQVSSTSPGGTRD